MSKHLTVQMVPDLTHADQNRPFRLHSTPLTHPTAHVDSTSQPLSSGLLDDRMRSLGVASRVLLAAMDHCHAGGHFSHRNHIKDPQPGWALRVHGASGPHLYRPLVADDLYNLADGV